MRGCRFLRVLSVITARAGEKGGRNESETRRGRAKEARRTPETAGGNSSETAGGRKEKTGGGRACPKETGTLPLRTLTTGLMLKEGLWAACSLPASHHLTISRPSFSVRWLIQGQQQGWGWGLRRLTSLLGRVSCPLTPIGGIVFSSDETLELISFAYFLGYCKQIRFQK